MQKLKTNVFFHGDCLFVMKHDIPAESIDLIYLDPPFFTGKVQKPSESNYNRRHIKWHPGLMEISYNDSKKFWGSNEKQKAIRDRAPLWLKHIALKQPDFASYLYYMMERLQECHRVLKSTGSIYLHCDWRASHYLKMVMDEIFENKNFKNEIVWHYFMGGKAKSQWSRKHDIIFYYTKNKSWIFNPQKWKRRLDFKPSLNNDSKDGETGKDDIGYYSVVGGDDVWDIKGVFNMSNEYTGYPTQKPLSLLRRIIEASSNPKDIILDPFCGCGTTIVAAHDLDREWIGVDINNVAVNVIRDRCNQLKIDNPLKPTIVERTNDLVLELNPKEFEDWVNTFYNAEKPFPDKGVDGITKDGIAIQSKTNIVSYDIVSRLLTDAEFHPSVPKPIKKIRIVSQKGFDNNTRKLAFEINTKKGIEVELITPEDMLKIK